MGRKIKIEISVAYRLCNRNFVCSILEPVIRQNYIQEYALRWRKVGFIGVWALVRVGCSNASTLQCDEARPELWIIKFGRLAYGQGAWVFYLLYLNRDAQKSAFPMFFYLLLLSIIFSLYKTFWDMASCTLAHLETLLHVVSFEVGILMEWGDYTSYVCFTWIGIQYIKQLWLLIRHPCNE